MKHKIVACIPCKNEEWVIGKTLKVLSEICYKIIVNDDNSTDKTQEICRSFPKVDLMIRPPRKEADRQGALQRQELLDKAYEYNPDYFFFIDADEIPTPDIIDFFENIDKDIVLWTLPWIHLWQDEEHYRIDSTVTEHGVGIHWDPDKMYRKGYIVKNVPDFRLKYDIKQHRVRPSNQPINCPEPHSTTDSTRIVHYSRIRPYFISGQSHRDRAMWDKFEKGANYDYILKHHQMCATEKGLKLKEVNPEWKWNEYFRISNIINEINTKSYYVLKNYYSTEFCDTILREVAKLNLNNIPKGEGGDYRYMTYEKLSKNAKEFLENPFFLKVGNKLLGHPADKKTKRCQLGILLSNNQNKCSGGGWHVDNHGPQFKALLYLTNVSEMNGPFAILSPPVKSNEVLALPGREGTRFSDEEIQSKFGNRVDILTGNQGDVILVNTSNIHRGTTIKESQRVTLTNYYYDVLD